VKEYGILIFDPACEQSLQEFPTESVDSAPTVEMLTAELRVARQRPCVLMEF
jgi:hypothetical protein